MTVTRAADSVGVQSEGPSWSTDPDLIACPVVAMALAAANGHRVGWHKHQKSQLIYATRGVMTLSTPGDTWVLPPGRALWIPAATEHANAVSGHLELHVLYIQTLSDLTLPGRCAVIQVSTLLREVILRFGQWPLAYEVDNPKQNLLSVFFDELNAAPDMPLSLPQPQDPRLRRIADMLLANPGDERTLDELAQHAGASGRTLQRLFLKDTKMTFHAWRLQAKMIAALQMLAAGEKVIQVGLALGYNSTSGFITAFHKMFGTTPSEYFGSDD